jgi:hypothetical protein
VACRDYGVAAFVLHDIRTRPVVAMGAANELPITRHKRSEIHRLTAITHRLLQAVVETQLCDRGWTSERNPSDQKRRATKHDGPHGLLTHERNVDALLADAVPE